MADSREVLDALPYDLVGRFEREGWLFTRSYNDEIGATVRRRSGLTTGARSKLLSRQCD